MLEHNAFQLISAGICVTIDADGDVLEDVGLLIEIALKYLHIRLKVAGVNKKQ